MAQNNRYKFEFDVEQNFDGLLSNKWNFRKEKVGRDDVLAMWVADMDFETSPAVKNAILKRAERGLYGYAAVTPSYTKALTDWFARRHQWTIEPEEIVQTPGVIGALHIAVHALSQKDDYILIQTPVYHPFFRVIHNTNRRVLENPLIKTKNGYEIDFADFEQKIVTCQPKVFVLCNPHNPTGRVYSKAELKRLGDICLAHEVIIIADEIHSDIVYSDAQHTPFATVSPELAQNVISCTAPSKTFNLAGLQNSNIIIPNKKIRGKFKSVFDSFGFPKPSLFSLVATEAAYTYGEAWLDQVLSYIEKNRDYALVRIGKKLPSIVVNKPQGTYFLWLDFNAYGLSNEALEKFLIKEAKVWFNQGYIFGEQGSGFVRVNIACPRSILEKALTQIEVAVAKLKA